MSLLCLLSAAAVLSIASLQAQTTLPDGNGKQIVQTNCVACHELLRITNAGHTRDEWDTVVHNMIMMGAELKPEQVSVVTNYLASNFPPKARSNAPTITGAVQANFKEFKSPTRAFPHDPYAAPDGSIWYSGQLGNVLGRVDSKNGQSKTIPSLELRPARSDGRQGRQHLVHGQLRGLCRQARSEIRPGDAIQDAGCARSPFARFSIRTASSGSPLRAPIR
jgi:hypothetical protein